MITFGPLGFTAPLMLWALALLPVIWFLLRAVPPAPVRRVFPAVGLLLGLKDQDSQSDRTPWWLLLLRMMALACVIFGLAGPVLNPQSARDGQGPLLVLLDGSWPAARDWNNSQSKLQDVLNEAGRNARPVAIVSLTDLPPDGVRFETADTLRSHIAGFIPAAWLPDAQDVMTWEETLTDQRFDTFWYSDGLARDGRDDLFSALTKRGTVTIFEGARPLYALEPVTFEDELLHFTVRRLFTDPEEQVTLRAIGPDPSGREVVLGQGNAQFEPGADSASLSFAMQPELRNRVTRFVIADQSTAGAIVLADDGLRRKEIALISGAAHEGIDLLNPLYYLNKALNPGADILTGHMAEILPANPDVIILADVADLPAGEKEALVQWVEGGGLLLRFAGPRMAASDLSRTREDILMPVRLRSGGRTLGGTMSWGDPRGLLPFDEASPFYGLAIPDDVSITSQVVAQPDPELSGRVIAALEDGTPLVTRKPLGRGRVVLFHSTANAEWNDLPLSGLFVSMLERLAVSAGGLSDDPADLAGTTWSAERVLDGFGQIRDAKDLTGVDGETLATGAIGPDLPPGLWRNDDQVVALNVMQSDQAFTAASWPAGTRIEGFEGVKETLLSGWLLLVALILLSLDALVTLALTGRLNARGTSSVSAMFLALALTGLPQDLSAQDTQTPQDDSQAIAVTSDVTFAHVLTGDPQLDEIAYAGLRGLSRVLTLRTSIEPARPVGVNVEQDELAFYPFIYWPISPAQPALSDTAVTRLNAYLRSGGMILFDTRDAGIAGTNGPNQRKLRDLAGVLDIPALEPVPQDHVLTRSFYLLQEFPGRHRSDDVWVEASAGDAQTIEGMPFRNLNDGVTPVVIGGNDWASAWAVTERGQYMLPVGRGFAGRQQREIAQRFGINLIMYVLTGNYKSDQVHVPELLERLGN